jgi:hypothetical protein
LGRLDVARSNRGSLGAVSRLPRNETELEDKEMGYVNDTQMSALTTPAEMTGTVGTWAMAVASNVWTLNKTAGDNTSVVKIPLKLPGNAVALKGAYLKSVDIWWSNGTADLDAGSAAIFKTTLPAQAGSLTAASVAFSYDTGHDAAAERITQAQHKMTLTVTTPFWVDDDNEVYVELTLDAAAGSVIKLQGARANYTLRI